MSKGYFKLMQATKLSELKIEQSIPESDLCLQEEGIAYQFTHVEGDDKVDKKDVKPGSHELKETPGGTVLVDIELSTRNLLESALSTKSIIDEANVFFNNLHVYEQLEEPKVRKMLLYSDPGCGKSSAISFYCKQQMSSDPGTVVLRWPTSEIDADDVSTFLSSQAEYTEDCTKLILIMEDIGGGERDKGYGRSAVDSSMLDLLDGIKVNFKLPTLIVATTNHPESMIGALADRPGRFDNILKIEFPSSEERVKIVEFIAKRTLTEEEKEYISHNRFKDFSIAYLKESVVRSMLHRKTLQESLKELLEHKNRFKNDFEDGNGEVGFS